MSQGRGEKYVGFSRREKGKEESRERERKRRGLHGRAREKICRSRPSGDRERMWSVLSEGEENKGGIMTLHLYSDR